MYHKINKCIYYIILITYCYCTFIIKYVYTFTNKSNKNLYYFIMITLFIHFVYKLIQLMK